MLPGSVLYVALGRYVIVAPDPAFAQAMAAQIPARAWRDSWLARHAAPRPGPADGTPGRGAGPQEPVLVQDEMSSATAVSGAVPAAPPKPVPPALDGAQREAGRLKALRLNAERRDIRAQLQTGELTLAQVLAQDDEAARGMRMTTVLLALPAIGAATAGRLLREAGIDRGHRVGGLNDGQRRRLVTAVGAMDAERAPGATGVRSTPARGSVPARG
jgi:hypothetical protein